MRFLRNKLSSQSCKNPPTDKFEVIDYKNSLVLAGDAGRDDVDDLKLNKTVEMCVGFLSVSTELTTLCTLYIRNVLKTEYLS